MAQAGDLWQSMYRRKKSTTQTCQPQQIDSVRTTSNFGLPYPTGSHLAASDTDAALVAQGGASFGGLLAANVYQQDKLRGVNKVLFWMSFRRTGRQASQNANLCIISTCTKRARNSRRISTPVLKDLNMPGINTCRTWPRWAIGANVMDIRSFAPSTKYGQQTRSWPRPASTSDLADAARDAADSD